MIVEQHADKTRAHVFFYSTKPYKRLVYSIKDPNTPKMDIKANGKELVVVTASPHGNGSKRQLLSDPEKIIYDCISIDDLDKRINTMLDKHDIPYLYESDNGSNNNIDGFFRFNPDEKIKVGSRHDDLIRNTNALIRKLYKTTTIEVIKASVIEYNKGRHEIPLPDKEVEQVFNDCLDYMNKQIEQEKEQEINPIPEIYTNIHYCMGSMPPKYIVASKETHQVIELVIKTSKDNTRGKYLFHNKTYLACAPTRIIRHKNPLTFLQTQATFSISFVDSDGEHQTLSHKTLPGIMHSLKDSGYVLGDGSDSELSAIINAYKEEKLIEDNEDLDLTGFFIGKDNKIIATNIDINKPSINELHDALTLLIEELKPRYENRLDLLATAIVWGMVAPIIFMLKTNNYFLYAMAYF